MKEQPELGDLGNALLEMWHGGPKPAESTPSLAIDRARSGSVADARKLLAYAAHWLRIHRNSRTYLPQEVAEYFAGALEDGARGGDLNIALNLNRRRGPSKFTNEQRDAWLAHNAAFLKMVSPRNYLEKTADLAQQVGLPPPSKKGSKNSEWSGGAVADAIDAHERRNK